MKLFFLFSFSTLFCSAYAADLSTQQQPPAYAVEIHDRKTVQRLISALAELSPLQIPSREEEFAIQASRVALIPADKLVVYLASTPKLRSKMLKICQSPYRWNEFEALIDYSRKMELAADEKQIDEQLLLLAKLTGTRIDSLRQFTLARDWKGLITHLCSSH